MSSWEPAVRAGIFDGELLTNIQFFGPDDPGDLCGAVGFSDVSTGSPKKVARFSRPPVEVFIKQVDWVAKYIDLRDERGPEIISQMGWPFAFWSSIAHLHPDRTRYTLELLDVGLRFAFFVNMRIKHALHCPRPIAYSAQVQPLILTPGHGSLPSGHATEAFLVATMLRHMLPHGRNLATQLRRQAARIATNRVVAGLHFPVDSAAGRLLGETLAGYVLARCGATRGYARRRFVGENFGADADADFSEGALNGGPTSATQTDEQDATTKVSGSLAWLWKAAQKEWL